jgi:DNA-binding MarR family transcriptional regulator
VSTGPSGPLTPPGARPERLVAALRRLARATSAYEASRAERAGLGQGALPVLEPLADAVALPAGQLGRRAGLAPSALSHALARHERAGLVERERQRGDGRVVLVRLTRDGRRALAPARASGARLLDAIETRFAASEIERLADDLDRLARAVAAAQEPGPPGLRG